MWHTEQEIWEAARVSRDMVNVKCHLKGAIHNFYFWGKWNSWRKSTAWQTKESKQRLSILQTVLFHEGTLDVLCSLYLLTVAEGITHGWWCEHLEVLLFGEFPSETSLPGVEVWRRSASAHILGNWDKLVTLLRMGAEMNIIFSVILQRREDLKQREMRLREGWAEGKPCAAGEAASPLEDSDQGMMRSNQETCRCSEEFGCFVRSAYFF